MHAKLRARLRLCFRQRVVAKHAWNAPRPSAHHLLPAAPPNPRLPLFLLGWRAPLPTARCTAQRLLPPHRAAPIAAASALPLASSSSACMWPPRAVPHYPCLRCRSHRDIDPAPAPPTTPPLSLPPQRFLTLQPPLNCYAARCMHTPLSSSSA
ncbi:hypothetical protein GGX14DRAFT_570329 [Mycena pura]|uniref:Uncharacterized protein n=1 Tax=Mycena pura TaxID=153505 RepID=A0AAD6V5F9_9AGAR|nr:hypothetical protein GGX14DRAFT_570329 [Mycena pura]